MIIDIYPECEPPEWMEVGAWCYCWGEAQDKFTVAALLLDSGGHCHGLESFTKLHRQVRVVGY